MPTKHLPTRAALALLALLPLPAALALGDPPAQGAIGTCLNMNGNVVCCCNDSKAVQNPLSVVVNRNCIPDSCDIACDASTINFSTLFYQHDATDDALPASTGGCSSCGDGSSGGGAKGISLRRYHNFRDQSQACSSFGPGAYSVFDISLKWYPAGNGAGEVYVPQKLGGQVTFFPQPDGTVYDRAKLTKGVKMFTAAGAVTQDPTQVARVITEGYDGTTCEFELFASGQSGLQYGRLLRLQDANGYGYTITYKTWTPAQIAASPSLPYQMDHVTDDTGRTYTFTYGATQVGGVWAVSSIQTPTGQTVSYAYGANGRLASVQHPDAGVSTFTYGTYLDMVTVDIKDPTAGAGHDNKRVYATSNFSYQGYNLEEGRLYNQSSLLFRGLSEGNGQMKYSVLPNLRLDDAGVNWNEYQYIIEGDTLRTIDGPRMTRYMQAGWQVVENPATGRLKIVGTAEPAYFYGYVDPDWGKTSYLGALSSYLTDRFELVNQTTDIHGSLLTRSYADGTSESWTYPALQMTVGSQPRHIASHTDRQGRTEAMTYDTRGNLLTRTDAVGTPEAATRTYAYYPAGDPNQYLLKSETDANGNTTDYTYDANHRLASKILPPDTAGGPRATYQYAYDTAGRLSQTTDPVGRTVAYTYDARSRVVQRNYCNVSTEQTVYGTGLDANRVIASKDRDNRWTAFRYDPQGRIATTIRGLTSQAQATSPTFVPDPAYHDVETTTYVYGQNLAASRTRNGEKTVYTYDYRNRLATSTTYNGQTDAAGNPVGLTTTSTYLDNNLLKTTDPFGRNTYYAYRASDGQRIRSVREAIPGGAGPLNAYSQVAALPRVATANAPYTIEDDELDPTGLRTAAVDGNGYRSETQYDGRGRATLQKVAVGTPVEAQSQTIYDAVSNVVEQRGPRYFDSADAGGYHKAATTMTYTGRNLLAARTDAPTLPEAGTTTFTYYLDGKQATVTDPNQNALASGIVTKHMVRPLCGWDLGTIDAAGHGTLTDTTIGGDAIHSIQVNNLASLTTTTAQGLVIPNFLNEVSMDVPDANTIGESTTVYDGKHRPIATTVWSGPLGSVYRDDAPIWWNGQVQGGSHAHAAVPAGVTGQTTLYYYSEDLTGTTLTHAFGPSINIADALGKLPASPAIAGISNGSARASMSPTGEVSVSIQDGLGRSLLQGTLAPSTYATVTWQRQQYDHMDPSTLLLETASISALGNTTTRRSDGLGRTWQVQDAANQLATMFYDANGNLTKSRDANQTGHDCTYDAQNRRVSCTDTQGDTTTAKYSVGGLVLNQQDGKGVWNTQDATYDARGRMLTQTSRLPGDTTTIAYDPNGNRLSVTDGEGKQTTYAYDVRNLKTAWTFPGQTSTVVGAPGYDTVTYAYDAAARLIQFTRQTGQSEVNTYAFNGTLTRKDFKNAAGTVVDSDTYTYDQANRPLTAQKGRYANTVALAYDNIGRKASESLTVGSRTYTTQNQYDADNRTTQITYPNGQVVHRTYTARNQLAGVTQDLVLPLLPPQAQPVATFTYDNGGRETARALGNGLTQTRTYRNDNLIQAMVTAGLPAESRAYTYDQNKNVTGETLVSLLASYGSTHTPDAKDRLIGFNRTNGDAQNWTLTKEGDWSQFATASTLGGSSSQARTHNDKHQITQITGNLTATPTYDAQGDLTTDERGRTCTWDQEKNLVSVTGSGTNESYTYDALGRRVSVTTSGVTTTFVSSGSQEMQEYNAASPTVATRTYIHGTYVDEVLGIKDALQGMLFPVQDRRYSTTAITTLAGVALQRFVYDPYGKVMVLDATGVLQTGATPITRVLWTGRKLDGTGNYYFRSRYFNTALGRFISRDSQYFDGWNLYEGYFAEREGMDPEGYREATAEERTALDELARIRDSAKAMDPAFAGAVDAVWNDINSDIQKAGYTEVHVQMPAAPGAQPVPPVHVPDSLSLNMRVAVASINLALAQRVKGENTYGNGMCNQYVAAVLENVGYDMDFVPDDRHPNLNWGPLWWERPPRAGEWADTGFSVPFKAVYKIYVEEKGGERKEIGTVLHRVAMIGDIVAFSSNPPDHRPQHSHVGIYLGHGVYLSATSGPGPGNQTIPRPRGRPVMNGVQLKLVPNVKNSSYPLQLYRSPVRE